MPRKPAQRFTVDEPEPERQSEDALQAALIEAARYAGWWVHHHYDSRRSTPGFPDLMMMRPGPELNGKGMGAPLRHQGPRELIFAELKGNNGRLTDHQRGVLLALKQVQVVEAWLWTPDVERQALDRITRRPEW